MKTSRQRSKSPLPPKLEPTPIDSAITLEATLGGPALAGILGRVLIDAGAEVTFGDARCIKIPLGRKPDLRGLKVHIARVVWVKEVRR